MESRLDIVKRFQGIGRPGERDGWCLISACTDRLGWFSTPGLDLGRTKTRVPPTIVYLVLQCG